MANVIQPMKAIAVPEGTHPKPAEVMHILRPAFDRRSVLVQTSWAGLCATDEPYLRGRPRNPNDRVDKANPMVAFHEVIGKVVARGDEALPIPVGTWVVPLVRRCQQWRNGEFHICRYIGNCPESGRPDRCPRNDEFKYISRGTGKLSGFGSQWFADDPQWLMAVPGEVQRELDYLCVLAEPMSIAQKGARLAHSLRRSLISDASPFTDNVLVVGLGPIGFLTAFTLRLQYGYANLYGADIYGPDAHGNPNLREQLLTDPPGAGLGLAGRYVQAERENPQFYTEWSNQNNGKFHIIVEATGVPSVVKDLVGALAPDGVLLVLGIPEGSGQFVLSGSELASIVTQNRVLAGSVNASRQDFLDGLHCLAAHHKVYADMLKKFAPPPCPLPGDVGQWLEDRRIKKPEEIKVILEFPDAV